MKGNETLYDVAVIGGGPAGMIAAGRAAELGARVVLLEKNSTLGKKLLITGGGRCNILNAELDEKKLVAKYGVKGKALFGSFSRFGVADTIKFFEDKDLPLKVEAEKRAFPSTDKSEDVWKVMTQYLKQNHVEIRCNAGVSEILSKGGKITGVKTAKGTIVARNYIIATGGKSRPETGSTGDGYVWMKDLGHSVEESDAALVPIKIKEEWVKELSGVSFALAKLTVFQDEKKQESRTGKILLTHFGISGPLVLNMSKNIAELHKYAPVMLELDMYPEFDEAAFDKKVLEIMSSSLNKMIRNNLSDLVPPKMVSTILRLTKIDPEKQSNSLTKAERGRLVKFLKAAPMTVSGFLGIEKAIVTSGGVALKEIDFKTMQSKLFPNLYLTGDILNFDRPSGGYSLQICWTTGYLAGENSATQSLGAVDRG
jgi:predicted Rossmann fold flavoprotein